MKLTKLVRFALLGWLAGGLSTLVVGLIWPAIFPGVLHPEHYFVGESLGLSNTILINVIIASLPALIGGVVGGILPREGGSQEQLMAAAFGGVILSIPFNCFNYWMLSGA